MIKKTFFPPETREHACRLPKNAIIVVSHILLLLGVFLALAAVIRAPPNNAMRAQQAALEVVTVATG